MTGVQPSMPARPTINQQPQSTSGNNNPSTLQHSTSSQHTANPVATDPQTQSEGVGLSGLVACKNHGSNLALKLATKPATLRAPPDQYSFSKNAQRDRNGNQALPIKKRHRADGGQASSESPAKCTRTDERQKTRFAIPANMADASIQQILKHGEVKRGVLGISIQDVKADVAKTLGLKKGQVGVLISEVLRDSEAEKAGLKAGDVIIELNGDAITSSSQLRNRVGMVAIGTEFEVTLIRDGKKRVLDVKVGARAEQTPDGDSPVFERLKGATLESFIPKENSITNPDERDVLYVPGMGRVKHSGNTHVTKTLEGLSEEFFNCKSGQEVLNLCQKTLDKLHGEGRRFLVRNDKKDKWDEIPDKVILKKFERSFKSRRQPIILEGADKSAKHPVSSERIGTNRDYERNIKAPNEKDILFGHADASKRDRHPGNVYKRKVMGEYKSNYATADHHGKRGLVRDIIAQWHQEGRRLIQYNPETERWDELHDDVAYGRVKSSLRTATKTDEKAAAAAGIPVEGGKKRPPPTDFTSNQQDSVYEKPLKITRLNQKVVNSAGMPGLATAAGSAEPNKFVTLNGRGKAFLGEDRLGMCEMAFQAGSSRVASPIVVGQFDDPDIVEGQFDDPDEDALPQDNSIVTTVEGQFNNADEDAML